MAGLHRAGALLLAHGKQAIWAHSQAVAEEAVRLAARFGVDAEQAQAAGLCHDLGGILAPDVMLARAGVLGWFIDPAEAKYPFLLHQRFSALLCREALDMRDEAVITAVGFHTTLRAQASVLDMVVYIADKLAWDQAGAPPYAQVVRDALARGLHEGCHAHIEYTLSNGMILMPHAWLLAAKGWLEDQMAEGALD